MMKEGGGGGGVGGRVEAAGYNVEKMSFGPHVEMTNCDAKSYGFATRRAISTS